MSKPGAIYEDTDKLGKRRYFAAESEPTLGANGKKASEEIRIRKITLQKVLTDIGKLPTQAKTPNELFEKVLWLLRDTTHYLAFAGYLARDGRVELVASKGWTEKLKSYISLQDIAPDSMSLVGRTAYHRRQTVMAMKDYVLMQTVKTAITKLGGEYLVVTPLLDHDRLVGVLTVINDKVLTPLDSEALQSICDQVAVALNQKLQEEQAVEKADDAVLYANLIARVVNDEQLLIRAADVSPGSAYELLQRSTDELVRALNENSGLPEISMKDAATFAVTCVKELAGALHKKANIKTTGGEQLSVSPLFKFAIYEVLKNSVEHSAASSTDIDIHIMKERTGAWKIEISDNGPGIPDEYKSEAFRPYKAHMKNPSGMGLYLVKKIANKYGGRVWVEDRVHGDNKKGASVVITIPPDKH